jgi:hypothetical protein
MDALITLYPVVIQGICDLFGASHATMHVHAGLAIYMAVQLLTRERRGSMVALNTVFAAEVANEVMDRFVHGAWNWSDTLNDVFLTMLWPVVITLVSQYRRRRFMREEEARRALQALALAPVSLPIAVPVPVKAPGTL